jgi:hypothetical protein
LVQFPASGDAQAMAQGSGRVIQAGMNDFAIACRSPGANGEGAFQDEGFMSGTRQGGSAGEANRSGSDDDGVGFHHL